MKRAYSLCMFCMVAAALWCFSMDARRSFRRRGCQRVTETVKAPKKPVAETGQDEIIRRICHIDVEAYARYHDVTPERCVQKISQQEIQHADIAHYVSYRLASRLQQRCLAYRNTGVSPVTPSFFTNFCYWYHTMWDEAQSDVENIGNLFVPSGVHIEPLAADVAGQYVCGYGSLKLDNDLLHDNCMLVLLVIEHEITHAEQSVASMSSLTPLYSDNPYQAPQEDIIEYEADFQAVEYVPFPYAAKMYFEAKLPYDQTSSQQTTGRNRRRNKRRNKKTSHYPSYTSQYDLAAKRTQSVSVHEQERQEQLYQRYVHNRFV